MTDSFVWVSRDAVWMTPLATLVIVCGAAAVAAVLARLSGRVPVRPAVAAACVMVTVFATMLCFTAIHPLASLCLAVGLGVRGYVAFRDAPEQSATYTRTTALVGAVALVGIVVAEQRARFRSPDRASIAAAPTDAVPNILILVLDTVRASSMSLYGWNVETTPQLSQLAAESTVYDLAIAPSSWSLPSHASMFTGVRTGMLNSDPNHPLQLSTRTLAETLRARGYATGAFTGNLFYTTYESGMMQGFDLVDDYRVTPYEIMLHANIMQLAGVRNALRARSLRDVKKALTSWSDPLPREPKHVMRNAANVLDAFRTWEAGVRGRPYMAFINLFDAHGEMSVPPTRNPALLSRRGAEGDYERRIAYIDEQVGQLIAELRADGSLDNTMLIITSDHGEQFGEHGLIGHGNSLYMPLLHIPLLVRYPQSFAAGLRIDGPLSLTDLPSTVAAVVGLSPGTFPGNPWPRGTASMSDSTAVLAEVGQMLSWGGPAGSGALWAIVTPRHLLIERTDGMRELFDIRRDPNEKANLAASQLGEMMTRTLHDWTDAVKIARHEVTASHM